MPRGHRVLRAWCPGAKEPNLCVRTHVQVNNVVSLMLTGGSVGSLTARRGPRGPVRCLGSEHPDRALWPIRCWSDGHVWALGWHNWM